MTSCYTPPANTPTPTRTPTPPPSGCPTAQASYNQCGGTCNGVTYPNNESIRVNPTLQCNGTTTYSCTSNGVCPNGCNSSTGLCNGAPVNTPTPTSGPPPPATCGGGAGCCIECYFQRYYGGCGPKAYVKWWQNTTFTDACGWYFGDGGCSLPNCGPTSSVPAIQQCIADGNYECQQGIGCPHWNAASIGPASACDSHYVTPTPTSPPGAPTPTTPPAAPTPTSAPSCAWSSCTYSETSQTNINNFCGASGSWQNPMTCNSFRNPSTNQCERNWNILPNGCGPNCTCVATTPIVSASVAGGTSARVNQTITYTGTYRNSDHGEILFRPTGGSTWTYCGGSFRPTSGNPATLTGNCTFSSVGTYYVAVNAWGGGLRCTGNPLGAPAGWINCGAGSYLTVTVSANPTPPPASSFTVTGTVFYDNNRNGSRDCATYSRPGVCATYSEAAYNSNGVRVIRVGTGTAATNSLGAYTVGTVPANTWQSVTLTAPNGYAATTTNPVSVFMNSNKTVNFGIALAPTNTPTPTLTPTSTPVPRYTISGNVFIDSNKDGTKNGAEQNYTGVITVTTPFGSSSYPAAGQYTLSNLIAGWHTLSYTIRATRLSRTYPVNGPPPSYQVRVGPLCATDASHGSYCSNFNILNLNFGISQNQPWSQFEGGDYRDDTGASNPVPLNPVPNPALCGDAYASVQSPSSNTPGIVISRDGAGDIAPGRASVDPYNWVVGGSDRDDFVPVNTGVIRTSYEYMITTAKQSGLTAADLPQACSTGCSLSGLAHGLYKGSGNIYLNSTDFTGGDYVILIDGNLYIMDDVRVANGSTATFSVSGDIIVDKNVGVAATSTACTPSTVSGGLSVGCSVEGFYSADNDFIVDGDSNCAVGPDLRFNLAGAVVVNAGLNGGGFEFRRDICDGNVNCPSVSFTERPDFILNAPVFIKHPNFTWQEVAP
ncbi:MAG: MSCRAMM family adhesin SdrC [Patescibacteria group bacterium]|nr:MSCRAMM family adhesin SdrC [Patescibacteria group bacterium]